MGVPFRACWVTALTLALCAPAGGCKRGNLAGQAGQSSAPGLEAARPSKCGYAQTASKPLVVDWPAAERAALESRAMQGPVAVHWEGCQIEVLTTCNGAGDYTYGGLNPKQETVRIRNADELYANLPVGAATLEGKLERFGSLEVDMTVIGRKEADRFSFKRSELDGRCERATHVVTGLTVGAFTFSAGHGAAIGGEASLRGGAGAGASSSSSSELLNTDGDFDACRAASQDDFEPPAGCGSLLRVEMVPVDEGGRTAAVRPQGGAGRSTDGDTQSAASSAEVEAYERKLKRSKVVYLSSYVAAIGFGLTSAVGFAMIESASEDITASKTDLSLREDAISKYRTGQILGWGGIGATTAAALVGIGALFVHNKTKAAGPQVSFYGAPQRRGANFGVRLRF